MTWTLLLLPELETAYRTVERLVELVEPSSLDWRPPLGQHWMTTGQLLRHLGSVCGQEMSGFVTRDWRPTAGGLPSVASISEARRMIQEDRATAFAMIEQAGEARLENEPAPAPWDGTRLALGRRLLEVVRHLQSHAYQLFHYLKLQGKPVDTGHLWGLEQPDWTSLPGAGGLLSPLRPARRCGSQ